MDKGIEALREAVRRAPLTKPEGLSPEWQAYFDAVTPLHVADLIAALVQAQQEYQAIEQKIINAAVYIETLESEPRKTNLKQLNEIAGLKRKCEELQEQKDKWSAWAISLGAKADELESRPICVKSNDAMREASIQTFVTELTRVVDAITGERLSAAKICEIRARILKCCLDKIGTTKPVKRN